MNFFLLQIFLKHPLVVIFLNLLLFCLHLLFVFKLIMHLLEKTLIGVAFIFISSFLSLFLLFKLHIAALLFIGQSAFECNFFLLLSLVLLLKLLLLQLHISAGLFLLLLLHLLFKFKLAVELLLYLFLAVFDFLSVTSLLLLMELGVKLLDLRPLIFGVDVSREGELAADTLAERSAGSLTLSSWGEEVFLREPFNLFTHIF